MLTNFTVFLYKLTLSCSSAVMPYPFGLSAIAIDRINFPKLAKKRYTATAIYNCLTRYSLERVHREVAFVLFISRRLRHVRRPRGLIIRLRMRSGIQYSLTAGRPRVPRPFAGANVATLSARMRVQLQIYNSKPIIIIYNYIHAMNIIYIHIIIHT